MRVTPRLYRALTSGAFALLVVIAPGCADDTAIPFGPPPPTSIMATPGPAPGEGNGFIWAMVVDISGICIAGGTISVVSGPLAGQTFVQDSRCDAWAYSGGVMFSRVPSGTTMTLRGSAPGYNSMDQTAVAAPSGQALLFVLTPTPPSTAGKSAGSTPPAGAT